MAEQLYRKRISPANGTNADDLVSRNVLAQLRRDPPPRPPTQGPADHGKPGTAGGSGSSIYASSVAGGVNGAGTGGSAMVGGVEASDLVSSMVKRLGTLEREMRERQSLLQQVQADNVLLKNKLKVAEEEIARRALAAIEPRDDSPAVMHLRAENARLRAQLRYAWKQVEEMKAFLNDYGMVWMGEPEEDAETEAAVHSVGSADGARGRAPPSPGAPGFSRPSFSQEPPDPLGLRRSSHSLASPGPSSAAAAAAAAALGRAEEVVGSSGSSMASRAASAAGKHSDSCFTTSASAALLGAAVTSSPASTVQSRPQSSMTSPRQSAPSYTPTAAATPSSSQSSFPVDMAELQAKVEELNDLAGDGCGQVVRDAAGQHVLAMRDPVSLVIYRDGLRIHTLPAKPFKDPTSAAVLRDILDGYFPYVLKRDFPDGVPLRVLDRTSEGFASATPRHVGGAPSAGGRGGNIHTFDDIDSQGGAAAEPMSRAKFLSRLPQAVIKNGKVMEIRSDISKILGGAASGAVDGSTNPDVALISTPVDALLSTMQRNHVGPSLPPPSRDGKQPTTEVTTLQVKSVDGKQTYILKLKYEDTIGSLRSCLDAHRSKAGHSSMSYEIRSAFPARAYTDEVETLRQAGLVPNATLFLRAM